MTDKQMKLIWQLARKNDMDSDALHAFAMNLTKKDSLKALTAREAAILIDRMMGKPQESNYRASAAQCGVILSLTKQMGWDNPERLRGFLKKRWRVESVYWLSTWQARTCIETLKSMLAAGRTERQGYEGTS